MKTRKTLQEEKSFANSDTQSMESMNAVQHVFATPELRKYIIDMLCRMNRKARFAANSTALKKVFVRPRAFEIRTENAHASAIIIGRDSMVQYMLGYLNGDRPVWYASRKAFDAADHKIPFWYFIQNE